MVGDVLKTLYDLDSINSLYYGADLVQSLCNISESEFNDLIKQLLDENLISSKLQMSYLAGDKVTAIKISKNGIEVVLGIKPTPFPIVIE
ncbi:MAG: hypothetical protein JST20_11815 [Bacteroidetes bacterium]|nr:hypothetical protein [Bacteroidota bacterium]